MKQGEPRFSLTGLRRRTRSIGTLTLLALVPTFGGCYGSFPATRAVYRINGDVTDNSFGQTIVFWIFLIIPVYGLAQFIDAIVLNLIEFWSGDEIDVSRATDDEGREMVFAPAEDGDSATLRILDEGREVSFTRFIRLSDREMRVEDADGAEIGRLVRNEEGEIRMLDADGAPADPAAAERIEALTLMQ